MKPINLITAFVLLLSTLALTGQEQTRIPAGIPVAIKAGNAVELTKYMNPTIELLLLDKEDFYKKNVAETVLKDFFKNYPTKDFIIRHQGARNDAQYAIGILKTERGDFRVYFLLKKVGQDLLIHQIRIESEDGR
ncbi:MAG: DUF4783 domain-containing protein [Bacteroidales bacterium]|nr:DUF4783 domain-containing protein [Bacteroidales bacterium]